jgi:CheY-like chemotaxis protein/two-component sensor histidine kinase
LRAQDYLAKISTSGQHLLSLINDVLDMSHIESGHVKIEEKEVHLPDVMHDLRTIVNANIVSKNIEFFIDAVDVDNEDILCDKLRLNQVLLNLLSNAVKYTKNGGQIIVRIIQKPGFSNGYATYEFHVKDNGIGMSKEFQKNLFEAFTREESATVSGIQGTGLGMAISKNIVDMMGGTISVESEEGKGTEYTVSIPFKVLGNSAKYEVVPQLQGVRVLVADDDSDTAISVSRMVQEIGMRSEWTLSGKEAVLRTRVAVEQGDEFGAYIIDWMMPDLNGIETVRRIRKLIGESKPIIILTAYDWADIEQEAREAGVTAFCSKPLFMSELRDVLSQPYRVKKEETPASLYRFEGKKVLLVEDNLLNQEIAQAILQDAGFTVDTADDGDVAVERLQDSKQGEFDLGLMDIQMPKMDGYAATRQIRTLPSDAANVPIVAMTANAFEEEKQKAIRAGMNAHIAKPIEAGRLMETLSHILT